MYYVFIMGENLRFSFGRSVEVDLLLPTDRCGAANRVSDRRCSRPPAWSVTCARNPQPADSLRRRLCAGISVGWPADHRCCKHSRPYSFGRPQAPPVTVDGLPADVRSLNNHGTTHPRVELSRKDSLRAGLLTRRRAGSSASRARLAHRGRNHSAGRVGRQAAYKLHTVAFRFTHR